MSKIKKPENIPENRAGRPPKNEPWTKATVILYRRQADWLRRSAAQIMLKSGAIVRQAEIVRGILDAITESGIDVTEATSEEDVKKLVLKKMRRACTR